MYKELKDFSKSVQSTPQTEPALGKQQVQNLAGGYSFELDGWGYLDRFLILGSCGTYYASGHEITVESAKQVVTLLRQDGIRVVDRIVEISESGRAPKNDPALFALALACSASFADLKTRQYALSVLPRVARIGTHLFHFAQFVTMFRGWGRSLKDGIAKWYLDMDIENLAYQIVKYQQRDGWSHKDLLRLSHPKTDSESRNKIFKYVTKGVPVEGGLPYYDRIYAHEIAKGCDEDSIVSLINQYGLTWESIPTEHLKSPAVWEALLQDMPMTAMVRNLARMTSIGLLDDFSDASKLVIDKIGNAEAIKKSRIHPMTLGMGLLTYQQGRGVRGSLSWSPVTRIIDALEGAFYLSLPNVDPVGKNMLVAIDVSGSMSYACAGYDIPCSNVAAMMGLIMVKTEPNVGVVYFDTQLYSGNYRGFSITPRSSLVEVLRTNFRGGGTDCALPMLYAADKGYKADVVLLSDEMSWAGDWHVFQALKHQRQVTGYDAKLVIANLASSKTTLADPEDKGSLNCVGLDTNLALIISDFLR